MNLSEERKTVRAKFPGAYAYKWAPRDWTIYAARDGAYTGLSIVHSQTSEAAAWINAARSPLVTP